MGQLIFLMEEIYDYGLFLKKKVRGGRRSVYVQNGDEAGINSIVDISSGRVKLLDML